MTENEKIAGDLLMSASSVFTPLDKDSIEKRQQRTKIEETISKKAEELERNKKIAVQTIENLGASLEELALKPYGEYVLIQPYSTNPFMGERKTESGLILIDQGVGEHFSQESGEWDKDDLGIVTGMVLETGPACKYVKKGDVVYYTVQSAIPIPFFHQGWIEIHEGRVLAVVNTDLETREYGKR